LSLGDNRWLTDLHIVQPLSGNEVRNILHVETSIFMYNTKKNGLVLV